MYQPGIARRIDIAAKTSEEAVPKTVASFSRQIKLCLISLTILCSFCFFFVFCASFFKSLSTLSFLQCVSGDQVVAKSVIILSPPCFTPTSDFGDNTPYPEYCLGLLFGDISILIVSELLMELGIIITASRFFWLILMTPFSVFHNSESSSGYWLT